MKAPDLGTYQRKRLNPYRGLVIDVPVWSDAHNYHRDQHRLHAMSSHRHGIVAGLEVVAWDPPDNSVVVNPGVAVDHEGNTILVAQPQRFYPRVEEPGMARIVVRYSEIVPDTAPKPAHGKPQPAYITEAFRIEEQRQRPVEPFIELARLQIAEGSRPVRNAEDPASPSGNDIDMRYRTISGVKPSGEIAIGVVSHRGGRMAPGWDAHCRGILSLAQSIERNTAYAARVVDAIDLSGEITDCDLLHFTGSGEFQLTEGERHVLDAFLRRGGVLFAEPCVAAAGGRQELITSFRSSFAALSDQMGHTLRTLERKHPVFQSCYAFATPPPGHDGNAALLGDDSIIFGSADYGCVWCGGRDGPALARSVIRDATEFAANIAAYAHRRSRLHGVKVTGR